MEMVRESLGKKPFRCSWSKSCQHIRVVTFKICHIYKVICFIAVKSSVLWKISNHWLDIFHTAPGSQLQKASWYRSSTHMHLKHLALCTCTYEHKPTHTEHIKYSFGPNTKTLPCKYWILHFHQKKNQPQKVKMLVHISNYSFLKNVETRNKFID